MEEKGEELYGCLTVIAADGMAYEEIKSNLLAIGLHEFADFIHYTAYNKKLAILYGNCHMQVLHSYLNSNLFFQKKYYLIHQHVINDIMPDSLWTKCDLLISQDIRKENAINTPSTDCIEGKTNSSCIKMRMPNLFGFHAFFPQSLLLNESKQKNQHIGTDRVDLSSVADKRTVKNLFDNIAKTDGQIDKMYSAGASISEIAESIRYEKLFDNVDSEFIKCIDKIKEREKDCSVSIADYIESNYKSMLLFYDSGHPTNEVIFEMGRRILKVLGIPICETGGNHVHLDNGEIPIYGCVKQALHMEFEQEFLRVYSPRFTLRGMPLTLEDYIEQYIIWNYSV